MLDDAEVSKFGTLQSCIPTFNGLTRSYHQTIIEVDCGVLISSKVFNPSVECRDALSTPEGRRLVMQKEPPSLASHFAVSLSAPSSAGSLNTAPIAEGTEAV